MIDYQYIKFAIFSFFLHKINLRKNATKRIFNLDECN
jgi:hypothetical protein